MLSPLDDYPLHQIAEVARRVGTSDRNFYDRYYFNCHRGAEDPFLILGHGQYPNLGVTDAFAVVRHGDEHIVVRASKALGADRMDTSVGPFRIEVREGLRTLRVVLEPGEHDLAFDLTFEADLPAHLESRQFQRQLERVVIDTQRFAQTGNWRGDLQVQGTEYRVEPGQWSGNRDRSWGVRPVGEAEPPGRRADTPHGGFFWIYTVMRFAEFAIVTIIQEDSEGRRTVEDATRIPADGSEPVWLGRPEHQLTFAPGSRDITEAKLVFHRPSGPELTVVCTPLLANYIGVGTGYGLEPDWRHGMWQGELAVQGLRRSVREIDVVTRALCPADMLARFQLRGPGTEETGTGMFELGIIGPNERYGFNGFDDMAAQ
ncbi:hypothetical protein [Sciscionella sediminilitoris]|uniref:hypothetical protein n=1 Tax=Sciscionella sediminilitoris TaxID=1445613 RepID=UPI0004DF87EF|nr:hypothetical protein [Sciscionella sp. SE31]